MLKINKKAIFRENLSGEVEKAFDKIMEQQKKGSQFDRIIVVIRGRISKGPETKPEPFCDVFID